jgi:hypothetical protein
MRLGQQLFPNAALVLRDLFAASDALDNAGQEIAGYRVRVLGRALADDSELLGRCLAGMNPKTAETLRDLIEERKAIDGGADDGTGTM